MSLPPDRLRRIIAILDQPEQEDFASLVHLSGLDPAQAFRRADLRDVDFGDADVSGYDVSGANLRGANLTRVRGRDGMKSNAATIWPERWGPPPLDFLEQAMRMVLRGEAPPVAWRPFITEMVFSDSFLSKHFWPDAVRVDGSKNLRYLTPLAGLTALRSLDLNDTQVSDVTPLAGLTALQTLWLTGTQVSDVTPLAGLTALQTLGLDHTRVSDVTPLAGLTALQTLGLTGTQVSDVTPLAALTALRTLWLNRTQVSDVTPLRHIKNLQISGGSASRPLKQLVSAPRRLMNQLFRSKEK